MRSTSDVLTRCVIACIARLLLVAYLALWAWALVPNFFGLHSTVDMSNSMAPAIRSGDVVIVMRVDSKKIKPGKVIQFRDPDGGAQPKLIIHRVVKVTDNQYQTKGDANAYSDPTNVTPRDVMGQGVLLVPWIGTPVRDLLTGRWPSFLTLATLVVMVVGATGVDAVVIKEGLID